MDVELLPGAAAILGKGYSWPSFVNAALRANAASEKMQTWRQAHDDSYERPDWDNYFMGLAFAASLRSHDSQTQCGCVIVDEEHRILGLGYNGFPRGFSEELEKWLPNMRPEKYEWLNRSALHAESNAIRNCTAKPVGGTAYITTEPCTDCIINLHGVGITEAVYPKGTRACGTHFYEDEVREVFLVHSRFGMREIDFDTSPLSKLVENINEKFASGTDVGCDACSEPTHS